MKNPQEEPKKETQYLDEMPNVDKKLLAKMWEDTIPRVDPKRGVFLMNAHGVIDTREPKQEYELKDFESSGILDVLNMGNVTYLSNGDVLYNPNLFFTKRDNRWFIKNKKPIQETPEHYAKLISSKEQQKQIITEIMDLDAKDGLYDTVNELDKLAEETFKGDDATTFVQREIWKDGYKKAKETLYTEEQVRKAMKYMEDYIQSLKKLKK